MEDNKNHMENIFLKTDLKEGKNTIENILIDIYIKGPLSNKILARENSLPIPVVSAIKREFIKEGLVIQKSGSSITSMGIEFVENELGYKDINKELYLKLINDPWANHDEINKLESELEDIFLNRPSVDVKIDQSKGTIKTGIRRGILALINNSLVGKDIVCVGDDDLISVASYFLLKKIFGEGHVKTKFTVIDIDKRILAYIKEISFKYNLNINTVEMDLREPLSSEYKNKFDTLFTDPPYTTQGLNLFLSRGVESLKKEVGLFIYLSFGNKSPIENLEMQEYFYHMKLLIVSILPNFNKYEGANILANQGQMIILNTTENTKSILLKSFNEPMYTGELRQTKRKYICKSCKSIISVGKSEPIKTIEELKNIGCSKCFGKVFDLVEKKVKK